MKCRFVWLDLLGVVVGCALMMLNVMCAASSLNAAVYPCHECRNQGACPIDCTEAGGTCLVSRINRFPPNWSKCEQNSPLQTKCTTKQRCSGIYSISGGACHCKSHKDKSC